MLRKLGVLAVTLALAVVLVPTTAQAHDVPWPHVHSRVEVTPQPNTGIPRDGVVIPETGHDYEPTPLPPGHYLTTSDHTYWEPPRVSDHVADCARLSDGRYSFGFIVTRIWKRNGGATWDTDILVSRENTCQYPPSPAVTDVTCAEKGEINVSGALTVRAEKSSSWALSSDRKDPVKCAESLNLSLDTNLNLMGRYTITGVGTLVPCKRFDYGGTQPTEIGDCGSPFTTGWTKPAQVWCDGWSMDHSGNHTYTMTECTERVVPPYDCNVPSVTLANASPSGPFAVLDDGKVRIARWAATTVTPNPSKVKNVVVQKTNVTVRSGSTPSRSGSQTALNQKYKGPPAAGWTFTTAEEKGNGAISSFPLQWYAPSTVGGSWIMDRAVHYKAQVLSVTVTITSMNPLTGAMVAGRVDNWIPSSGECKSAPLVVKVNRARNFR